MWVLPFDVSLFAAAYRIHSYIIITTNNALDSFYRKICRRVVNKKANIKIPGNDQHIIWVFTRDRKPKWCTYEKAMNDIIKSGLNPNYLVKIDNSIILKDVQTVTKDDAEGIIEETTMVTTTTTKSTLSSTDSNDEYSSTTTTTTTTVSTVEFTLKVDYTIPYEFDYYEKCGNIKILKNIRTETVRIFLFKNILFLCTHTHTHKYKYNKYI